MEYIHENKERSYLERYECTAAAPWTEDMGKRSFHPDARVVGEADDIAFSAGNRTTYECPNCGLVFKVTEPDS